MTPPWYRVTVANIFPTAAWSYSTTQGDTPDPDDLVQLGDGLTYAWEWEAGLIPGQLAPSTATVRLLCRTADDVPAVDVGDLLAITVEIYDTAEVDWVAVIDKVMRVSAVEVDLTPPDDGPVFGTDPAPYAAVATIDSVDLTADLRSTVIDGPLGIPAGTYGGLGYSYRSHARSMWRYRLAEVAVLAFRSIGAPTWWATVEQPTTPTYGGTPGTPTNGLAFMDAQTGGFTGKTAHQLVSELCNTYQPLPATTSYNITHAIAPYYSTYYGAGYPSGWSWVAGAAGGTVYNSEPAPTDPDTNLRYVLVGASRRAPTTHVWHGSTTLDADWCRIPAKARRSREHIVNTLRLGGRALVTADDDASFAFKWTDSVLEYQDGTDAGDYGPSTRDLPTHLTLFRQPNPIPVAVYPAPGETGPRYLSVASARNAGYSYDTFILQSSLVPDTAFSAATVLARLAPRWPGEAWGDGQLLRHITIDNLDPAVAFGTPSESMIGVTPDLPGTGPYTLSSEFTVNTDGLVTALRFHRHPDATDTSRTMRLWHSSGTILATVTTDESTDPSGWVTTALTTPVPVTAGETYVVGYDATSAIDQKAAAVVSTTPHLTWDQGRYDSYPMTTGQPAGAAGALNWFADVVYEPPGTVTGFLRAGVMSVADGDITWNLTLTPGDPT